MIERTDLSGKLALDTQALGQLRQSARANTPEATRAVATQFEALFINMMMKSMRDATPQDSLMDDEQGRMFTTMLDQQLSQNMAQRGIGLADMLVRQLSQAGAAAMPAAAPGAPMAAASAAGVSAATAGAVSATPVFRRDAAPHVREFQQKMSAHAEEASRETGIPARFMIGQAALETGWGRREIRHADGNTSHNLFGIKAGGDWKGKVALSVTTEYENGVPHTRIEKFRAYDSYADSFRDYARMVSTSPRYQGAMAGVHDAAAFAAGLQKAGYATDPFYAAKLARIINHTLA